MAGGLQAQTFTWDGGGTRPRWVIAENWADDVAPSMTNTTDIIIPDTVRDNALTYQSWTLRSLTFDATIGLEGHILNVSRANTFKRFLTFESDTGIASLNVEAGSTGEILIDEKTVVNGNEGVLLLNDPLNIVHNGTGGLTLQLEIAQQAGETNGVTKSGAGTVILNRGNTYTGDTTVEDGVLTLSDGGSFAAAPLGNGVSNVIAGVAPGSGTLNFEGVLSIDLSNADTTPGNSWLLVDASNLAASPYGATFSVSNGVSNFSEQSDGVWVFSDGSNSWTFTEATGSLTVEAASNLKYWTGVNGATWDAATTANFSNNSAADPLDNTTFDVATALTNAAFFADSYEANGGNTTVSQGDVMIAEGGVETGSIGFLNTSALGYTITSSDAIGIAGNTNLILDGSGTVTLLGQHATSGSLTISEGNTLNLGEGFNDASISLVSAIVNDGTLTINAAADPQTLAAGISGIGSLEKTGDDLLTIQASSSYTGATTISAGFLTQVGAVSSSSYDLAAGTVLDLNFDGSLQNNVGDTIFRGLGTLRKTGTGQVRWAEPTATYELGSGALIEVLGGTLRGGDTLGGAGAEVWTNNLADLFVGPGAIFRGQEGMVRVDAIDGSGAITAGFGGADETLVFTYGVDNGSGSFSGTISNGGPPANFTKVGTGTQTLAGLNAYTGKTTVEEGTIIVTDTGQLAFAPGENSVINQMQGVAEGTGVINFDGKAFFNLTPADTTPGNSWVIADETNLTLTLGETFSVGSELGDFVESEDVWTLDAGGNIWTFTEATRTLEVAPGARIAASYEDWLATFFPDLSDSSAGGDPDGDGIGNVLEYILNSDPRVAAPVIIPTADASGDNFVFTFDRLENSAADTTQVFEYCSDLINWIGIDITNSTESEVNIGVAENGMQTITVTISKNIAVDGKIFCRVNATLLVAPVE